MTKLDNVHRFGLTQQDQFDLLQGIAEFVRESVKAAVEPRDKLIAELIQRIEELELQGIRDMGGWQRPVHYRRGDLVSCNSHIWIAVVDNGPDEEPGTCTKWRMARRSPELEQQRQKERRATQGGPRSSSIVERRP